jgi:hypothetical protein
MNETTKIRGFIAYKLIDSQGNVKAEGNTTNIVTEQGLKYYVDQLSASNGSVAQLIALGTGTTAVSTANTWVGGYFAGNGTIAGTAGSAAITGSGTALQYVGTFSAGYATQDGITRVGLTNMVAAADGNGTPNGTSTFFIAHGTIDPTVNKGSADTLVVTWNHLFS